MIASCQEKEGDEKLVAPPDRWGDDAPYLSSVTSTLPLLRPDTQSANGGWV